MTPRRSHSDRENEIKLALRSASSDRRRDSHHHHPGSSKSPRPSSRSSSKSSGVLSHSHTPRAREKHLVHAGFRDLEKRARSSSTHSSETRRRDSQQRSARHHQAQQLEHKHRPRSAKLDEQRPHSARSEYGLDLRSGHGLTHDVAMLWPGRTTQRAFHSGFTRAQQVNAVPPPARDDDDESPESFWETKPWHQGYSPTEKPWKFKGQPTYSDDYRAYTRQQMSDARPKPKRRPQPEQTSVRMVEPGGCLCHPLVVPSYVERAKQVKHGPRRETFAKNEEDHRFQRALMKTPVLDLAAGTASWKPKYSEQKTWFYDLAFAEEAGLHLKH
eukprot:gnl/MRDRNA2_/MRDRNA2_60565_c0_seq1.p1 gnl/MRDRNA2_/MRDRNA2_60565_c0~~gnl/MRDRNA2_/MRDRNA2_60565_c0_seq1.p1  ORF type:complete len:329 (+),score=35.62 gnl/MRDRNA2_/MRDRNA2_60565_c0_seq1:133-1119(+)